MSEQDGVGDLPDTSGCVMIGFHADGERCDLCSHFVAGVGCDCAESDCPED